MKLLFSICFLVFATTCAHAQPQTNKTQFMYWTVLWLQGMLTMVLT
jgi:hypothetical protein